MVFRTAYVDGALCKSFWIGDGRGGCGRMSGLLMRPVRTAGQDGFRNPSSKRASDIDNANL